MIPKTKVHFKEDVVDIVNKIESKGLDVEVSELDGEIYLCGYEQEVGIHSEFLFDLTWDELTGILEKNGVEYFESRD